MSEDAADQPDPWSVPGIEAHAPDARSLTAARDLLRGAPFPHVQPVSGGRGWWAVCQGTTDLYRVQVHIASYGFESECACPSRKHPCKHALALLLHLAEHPELRTEGTPHAPADFEGLLRAIFADPDDDTPRLAFADYLDENNGQADRAALVRVQCGQPGDTTDDELIRRLDTEFDLPDGFDMRVARGFVRLDVSVTRFGRIGGRAARVVNLFRNGWVESVRFTEPEPYYQRGRWNDDERTLLSQTGTLDFSAVRLTDVELAQLATDLRPGAAGGRLARVRVHPLDEELYTAFVQGTRTIPVQLPVARGEAGQERQLNATPEELSLLIGAGRLDDVGALTLWGTTGDAGLGALAAEPRLRFVRLAFPGDGVGADGLGALAAAPWFSELEQLQITGGELTAHALAALECGTPLRLAALELTRTGIDDDALAVLARQPFPTLRTLELPGNRVTETGVAALLASEHLPELFEIDLADNPFPRERLAGLVLSARDRPRLDVHLQSRWHENRAVSRTVAGDEFRLSVPRASTATVDELAPHPALGRVTALALCGQPLSAETVAALAAALSPERLRELDLAGCTFDDTLSCVLRFCALPGLTTLTLARLGLKYATVARLVLTPAVARLRVLDLSDNPLGPTGLDAVLNSPHLTKVERFVFRGTMGLSLRDRAHFQKRFGARAQFA